MNVQYPISTNVDRPTESLPQTYIRVGVIGKHCREDVRRATRRDQQGDPVRRVELHGHRQNIGRQGSEEHHHGHGHPKGGGFLDALGEVIGGDGTPHDERTEAHRSEETSTLERGDVIDHYEICDLLGRGQNMGGHFKITITYTRLDTLSRSSGDQYMPA